jgi:hypothetical protein
LVFHNFQKILSSLQPTGKNNLKNNKNKPPAVEEREVADKLYMQMQTKFLGTYERLSKFLKS